MTETCSRRTSTKLKKRKRGRPTKLTPELINRLGQFLRKGHFTTFACAQCGITTRSFSYWMVSGGADEENERDTIHADFFLTIKKSEAEAEDQALQRIRDGAFNWQSAAWFLERKFPDRWGRPRTFSRREVEEFVRNLRGILSKYIGDAKTLEAITNDLERLPDTEG